jgi:adenosine/AMP kinase
MVNAVPGIKFGVAFCEASDKSLVRASGTDEEMLNLAKLNAYALSAGHSFIVFMRDAYPINVLRAIKDVPEVCTIFAATANALQVLVAESEQGRGIIGVIDGQQSKGIETEADVEARKQLLRKIGYKA